MYCRILSKREANMFWLKISETFLCPSIAYLGVLIQLYTTNSYDSKRKLGSGGILTHASEETGA